MVRTPISRHGALIASVAFYGIISVVSTTLFYKELYVFGPCPFFINNLNTALTAVIPVVIAAALTCLLPVPPHGVSTPAALCGALGRPRLVVILGLLNSVQNTAQIAAINSLGPRYSATTTLVGQSVIPFTLLLSCIRRRRRARTLQLLGAALVVAGVGVVVGPRLMREGGGPAHDSAAAAWVAVYLLSGVPQALLNVLIEEAFADPSLYGTGAASGGGGGGGGGVKRVVDQLVTEPEIHDELRSPLQGASVHLQQAQQRPGPPHEQLQGPAEGAAEEEDEEERHSGLWYLTRGWAADDLAAYRRHPACLMVRSLGLVAAMNAVSFGANFALEGPAATAPAPPPAHHPAPPHSAPHARLVAALFALCQHGSLAPLAADFMGGGRLLLAPGNATAAGAAGGDAPWVAVLRFAPLGALFIVGAVLVDHCGSATAMFLVTAACLPLQDYALSLPAVMGGLAAPLSPTLWWGLAITVSGLVGYGMGTQRKRDGQ